MTLENLKQALFILCPLYEINTFINNNNTFKLSIQMAKLELLK